MNRTVRPPLAVCASFALVATSLVWLSSGAQATPSAGARVTAPGHAAAPAAALTSLTGPVLISGVLAGDTFGVTVEPAGGTIQPTVTPIVGVLLPS